MELYLYLFNLNSVILDIYFQILFADVNHFWSINRLFRHKNVKFSFLTLMRRNFLLKYQIWLENKENETLKLLIFKPFLLSNFLII